jgi:chitin synthase
MEKLNFNPKDFEYLLMVDADTSISCDSITKLVSCMVSNIRIIGLCGETFITNDKDTMTTMIQVYEYFISHNLSKAFESMFGSVTCLPGCFSMYRIISQDRSPLLISPMLIEDYADTNVDTLHKKNLLSLGEDRYLTTLVMKHFPNYKTMFTSDAT